jgi:hypothetical protein
MPLLEKFELSQLIHCDVAETWLAVEKVLGRRVLLHKIPKESGLRERLLSMAPEDLITLLSADNDGDFYIVVTHDIPDLRRFREWIESRSAPGTSIETLPAPSAAPVGALDRPKIQRISTQATEPGGLGEATQLFSAFDPSKGAGTEKETVATKPEAEPGEFTRMFAGPPVRNEPNTSAPPEPGEFTRMFTPHVTRPDAATAMPAVNPAPANSSESGEFTKIFSNPGPTAPLMEKREISHPQSAKPALPAGPSEFTGVFGQPNAPPTPQAEVTAPQYGTVQRPSGADATGIFSERKPSSSGSEQTPVSSGPGEYTRIVRRSPVESEVSDAPAPVPSEKESELKRTPQQSSNYWPLIIVLSVLLILAGLLLVYVLAKR